MAVSPEPHSIRTLKFRPVKVQVLYVEKTSVAGAKRSVCTVVQPLLGLGTYRVRQCMLSITIDVAGRLGFIPFEQSTAKCFTSILADVYYSAELGNIASNLHDHCYHRDRLHACDLAESHDLS